MGCLEKYTLQQMAEGALSGYELELVQRHIDSCRSCRSDCETFKALAAMFCDIAPSLPNDTYFSELPERINRRIYTEIKPAGRESRDRIPWHAQILFSRKLLPYAAVLILFTIAGGAWLLVENSKKKSAQNEIMSNVTASGRESAVTKPGGKKHPINVTLERADRIIKKSAEESPYKKYSRQYTVNRKKSAKRNSPAAREAHPPEANSLMIEVNGNEVDGGKAGLHEANIISNEPIFVQAMNEYGDDGEQLEREIALSGALHSESQSIASNEEREVNRDVLYLLQVVNTGETTSNKYVVEKEMSIALRYR